MATTLVTSDEINYLVYRYLQESGFQHTAFTFGMEANIAKTNVNTSNVPPGALVAFLQKGLQFIELEQSVEANGCDIEYAEPISLLNTAPSRNVVKRETGSEQGGRGGMDVDADASTRGGGGARERGGGGERERERERGGAAAEEGVLIPESEVSHLAGHTSEVFICAWSPTSSLLASGSGDATARIWSVGDARDASSACKAVVLKHSAPDQTRAKDVTTLDWSPNGSFLATGSYDGRARVWTAKGELVNTLGGAPTGGGGAGAGAGAGGSGGVHHEGPIFALKWNKASTLLLSGSVDKTAIVWDAATGAVKQHFRLHKAPTLDVDWRDDDSFASCSTDRMVYVCRLGEAGAVRSFAGHTDEVNCVKWSPRGRLLASCSDDCTARVWSVEQNACVHTFGGHSQEIYTIKWSPESNARGVQLLASASLDKTVRLWDVGTGQCAQTLARHSEPVYSVAFSPNGELLASGSPDKSLHIWSLRDGSLVKTYKGSGGIYEVCWNRTGTKVAACFSTNSLVVVDMRM